MRKETIKYYFSVEGETEQWYLNWLQGIINNVPERTCNVKFDSKIQKDPLSRAKGLIILGQTKITHIFDRESESSDHEEQFKRTLEKMKKAENIGKKLEYQLGYSNFRRILGVLTIENVKDAITRAKNIMKKNQEDGYVLQEYKGYKFYKENPSLSIWEITEKILCDSGLL